MDRSRFLLHSELFRSVPEQLAIEISAQMTTETAHAGEVIFEEGDAGDAVYLIEEGTIALRSRNVYLMSRGVGDCFGEFALIDEAPRSASAVAESDVRLLKWSQDAFQAALAERRELARALFTMLTGKLRDGVGRQVEVRRDLERAHEVQMAMMPKTDFVSDRLIGSGFCKPAATVGGDFYDLVGLDEDRVAQIIVDVMGHGFYAGLLVAMAKSCLHTQARANAAPDKMMRALNQTVALSVGTGLLATCCYAVTDSTRGVLSYSNAGHVAPFHFRAAEERWARLPSTDTLLGVPGLENDTFECVETEWGVGDRLVMFSDGVSEAPDANDIEFGEKRIQAILEREGTDVPASDLVQLILSALADHCAETEQSDDITLVVSHAL